MTTQDATTVNGHITTITRKRTQQQYPAWAGDHVYDVLNGGAQTLPATGEGEPIRTTITWTHPDIEGAVETVVRTFGSQAEHDLAVDAMEDAIEAAGGTVTSTT